MKEKRKSMKAGEGFVYHLYARKIRGSGDSVPRLLPYYKDGSV
jgi:hypothetical protein